MFEKTLHNLGLSQVQAEILDSLLNQGADKASSIAKKIKRPRGVAYKGLDELMRLSLVTKTEETKGIAIFSAEHPSRLEAIADQKAKDALKYKEEFISTLPDLVSAFNLVSNKPGVRFYEGEEGVKKVLEDNLLSNPEKKLYTFSDVASYATYLSDWNTNYYAPKRKKLGVFERVIIPNNTRALEYMKDYKSNEVTDILFIDHKSYPFATEINIYNNKVSFVTFSPDFMVGVIIDNKEIFETLLSIFNFFWTFGKNNLAASQPDWLKQKINRPLATDRPTAIKPIPSAE
ncbi:MAG: helix-turn-helix domain-containing protein [Patescibacteria group bacterium]|jgi:predicted transcriptional regulator